MSRRSFILSHGASCKNWRWSWSFVNDSERFVIFGAWDRHDHGAAALILSPKWAHTESGRQSPGYTQAREHVRLIEEESYRLFTFLMKHARASHATQNGPSRLAGFERVLTPKRLVRRGRNWYAVDLSHPAAAA